MAFQALSHSVRALQKLHKAGYAHRDLKPGNVLRRPRLHDWTLIDFGCAARIGALPWTHVLYCTHVHVTDHFRAHRTGALSAAGENTVCCAALPHTVFHKNAMRVTWIRGRLKGRYIRTSAAAQGNVCVYDQHTSRRRCTAHYAVGIQIEPAKPHSDSLPPQLHAMACTHGPSRPTLALRAPPRVGVSCVCAPTAPRGMCVCFCEWCVSWL